MDGWPRRYGCSHVCNVVNYVMITYAGMDEWISTERIPSLVMDTHALGSPFTQGPSSNNCLGSGIIFDSSACDFP